MKSRKGTEKPIEIFVALFIILAVALVMLKLFQSQISDKQKELSDVAQAQKTKELRQTVIQACSDKCVEASNSQCSMQSLASLCLTNSKDVLAQGEYLDLNNNKNPDLDRTLLAGVGVCEDRVYCFHLMRSCCNREISAASCKTILRNYWDSQKLDVDAWMATVTAGTCQDSPTRWDRLDSWTK